MVDRRQQLETFLRENPDDAFARYGLAMALMAADETDAALEQFRELERRHPDYPAGYHQAGQLLARLGRMEEARTVLAGGIAAAGRKGDGHAQGEMQALLDELGAV